MELKKNPKLNIYLKRELIFNFSMVISLIIIIMSFEWKFYYDQNLVDLFEIEDDFEEIIEGAPYSSASAASSQDSPTENH